MDAFNQQGRLFTFGCSITKYLYPTWADIIGASWDYYENWGKPSFGNEFIFNSIIECNVRNKFTSNDTILIMWSGIVRIDYYLNHWRSVNNKLPDGSGLDKLIPDIDGYEMKTNAYINAINNLLSSTGTTFKMMSWQPYDDTSKVGELYKDTLHTVAHVKFDMVPVRYRNPWCKQLTTERLYERLKGDEWPPLVYIIDGTYKKHSSKHIINEINEFFIHLETYDLTQDDYMDDNHPLPSSHLVMVENNFPLLRLSDGITDNIMDIEYKLMNGLMYDFKYSNPLRF